MMKWLGAVAMVLTALLWAAPQAEAAPRCWWNGYTWVCRPPAPRPWVRPWRPYYRPYAYYAPGWRYYRPYHRRW